MNEGHHDKNAFFISFPAIASGSCHGRVSQGRSPRLRDRSPRRVRARPPGDAHTFAEPPTRTDIWQKVEASVDQARLGGGEQYQGMVDSYRASVQGLQRGGNSPARVAETIIRLTEARSPPHRVLVGDARLMALLTAIATRLRDRMMARGLGLPEIAAALKEAPR